MGLQDANTGPSEAPIKISPQIPFFCEDFCNKVFDFSSPKSIPIFFHKFGNNSVIPKNKTIDPENIFQKIGGIVINAVENFSNNVNKIIETLSDAVIIYGLYLFLSVMLPPIITGKSGKTQGANIVNTPAKKEKGKRFI